MKIKYPEYWKYKQKCGIYKIKIQRHIYIGSSVDLYERIYRHVHSLLRNCHENDYIQRAYNKYKNIDISVIEVVNFSTEKELLELESFWVKKLGAKLNLRDPVTERGCPTTSKKVYQFSLYGELVKEWESAALAARTLGFDATGITVAILRPGRQRIAGGFLWSRDKICNTIDLIDVYKDENFVGTFTDSVDVYENLYKGDGTQRKAHLSKIKFFLDKNKSHKGYKFKRNTTGRIKPDELLELHHKMDNQQPSQT
jgi:hypothetical protein